MNYLGSKRKLKKHLLPVILQPRKPGQLYVEPFMGGCNMLEAVPAAGGPRWANDVNPYLVAMFRAFQKGWEPPTQVSYDYYHAVKMDPCLFPPELVAFVAFNCSFAGKWWAGYARDKTGRTNYAERGARVLKKQLAKLHDVAFWNMQYWQLPIPPRSLIYCDPPYAGTTGYRDAFNSPAFWEWVRLMCDCGHTVFVSEYDAPPDFGAVVEIDHSTRVNKGEAAVRTERLFVYMG